MAHPPLHSRGASSVLSFGGIFGTIRGILKRFNGPKTWIMIPDEWVETREAYTVYGQPTDERHSTLRPLEKGSSMI